MPVGFGQPGNVMVILTHGDLTGLKPLLELAFIVGSWVAAPSAEQFMALPIAPPEEVQNTQAIGEVLYTRYFYLFQAAGLVLLVAMIGAIVLTLRHREGVRRQNIGDQIWRRREEAVEIKKVTSGTGI